MRRIDVSGGPSGGWQVTSHRAVIGQDLAPVERVDVAVAPAVPALDAAWVLPSVVSNTRYTTRSEAVALRAAQPGLGRPAATRAVLIPIRKSEQWWALAQDERREIFEETSHHIAIGTRALPAVARRLHHCRDLGGEFDFLTWFEFAPVDEPVFDAVLAALRDSPEWQWVDREVELRMDRDDA
jgi:hypothetical protein